VHNPPTWCEQSCAVVHQVDLKRYTTDTYMRIVTFKTAYYSFYLPVACGLLIGGVSDDASLDLAKDICVRMGQYFQVAVELCHMQMVYGEGPSAITGFDGCKGVTVHLTPQSGSYQS
jgi:hypothetical protein